MYFKVLNTNHEIVGVESIETPEYVTFQERNHIYLRSGTVIGDGMISADGNLIYAIDGVPQKTELDYTAVPISEADYNFYSQQLEWPFLPEEPEEQTDEDTILTPAEMMRELKELKEYVGDLRVENEFLTECLLEMSETVYA